MTDPGELAEYFGFTEREVFGICEKYGMNFEEAKAWYDGYQTGCTSTMEGEECYSMYSPKSVVEAMLRHKFGTYWNQTETYEASENIYSDGYGWIKRFCDSNAFRRVSFRLIPERLVMI